MSKETLETTITFNEPHDMTLRSAMALVCPGGDDEPWEHNPYAEQAQRLLDAGVTAQLVFDVIFVVVRGTASQFGM